MLILVGKFLMTLLTFISGSGLNRYLIAKVLKLDPNKDETREPSGGNFIVRRRPARFTFCSYLCACCKDSVDKRLYGVA